MNIPECGGQNEFGYVLRRCPFPRPMPNEGEVWTCPRCSKRWIVKALVTHHWQEYKPVNPWTGKEV